jgi:hypothetical protein
MKSCLQTEARFLKISFWLFFFWQYWGLNSEPHSCKAGVLPLVPLPADWSFLPSQLCSASVVKNPAKPTPPGGSWHIIIKVQRCLKHHKYFSRRKYWQYWRARLRNFHMTLCFHNIHSISWSSHSYSPFILLTWHFDACVKTIVKTITRLKQHYPSESRAWFSGGMPSVQTPVLSKPVPHTIILATQEV